MKTLVKWSKRRLAPSTFFWIAMVNDGEKRTEVEAESSKDQKKKIMVKQSGEKTRNFSELPRHSVEPH